MRKLFLVILMVLVGSAALAQGEYVFEYTTEQVLVDGVEICINWQGIVRTLVTFDKNPDGSVKVYPVAGDGKALSVEDTQSWYVKTEDGTGWYGVSFKLSDLGILPTGGDKVLEYWFRYDGSAPGAMVYHRTGPPAPKAK